MAYCTRQDLADRYGQEELLLLADRDQDGIVDAAVFDQAAADAAAEIDAYLAGRYALPLETVPPVLARVAVDIVVYRLAASADLGTDERRRRYEDAVALLRRIGSGDVSLGLAEPQPSINNQVEASGPERRFSRASMKGVL